MAVVNSDEDGFQASIITVPAGFDWRGLFVLGIQPGMSTVYLNARDLGIALGMSCQTVIRLQKSGAIPAEIAEGRLYRFDLEKVKKALADRAAVKVTTKTTD
ncbi:MAG: hypothetical protein V4689_11775 [Verrucomicrobiota bacterium]